MSSQLICDFCSSERPVARLFASDVEMPIEGAHEALGIEGMISEGDWAACIYCLEMIEQRHWKALADRSWRMFQKAHPGLLKGVPKGVKDKLKRDAAKPIEFFRKSWSGMIEPI